MVIFSLVETTKIVVIMRMMRIPTIMAVLLVVETVIETAEDNEEGDA